MAKVPYYQVVELSAFSDVQPTLNEWQERGYKLSSLATTDSARHQMATNPRSYTLVLEMENEFQAEAWADGEEQARLEAAADALDA